MKKPQCPICSASIKLQTVQITSNNGGESNWMGNSVSSQYVCSHNSDVCRISRDIYLIVTRKQLVSHQDINWRIPLSRYIRYTEFCIDNHLQEKLLIYCNQYGELDINIQNNLLNEASMN